MTRAHLRPDPVDAFWARLERRPSGCWEFAGATDDWGYGRMTWDARIQRTHRIAYQLTQGPIPAGMIVMHSCDNPPCCNPDHLSVGTVAENNRDRHMKGRTVVPYKTPSASQPHGTRPRFRSGCRCDPCRSAESERKRPIDTAYRERRRRETATQQRRQG